MAVTCQTPYPDTATTRVSNAKLRLLIGARESGRICQQQAHAQDSLIRLQEAYLRAKDSLLTDRYNEIHLYDMQHGTDSVRIWIAEKQTGVALTQLGVTEGLLKRQTRETYLVGGIGGAIILFFSYLLIKK